MVFRIRARAGLTALLLLSALAFAWVPPAAAQFEWEIDPGLIRSMVDGDDQAVLEAIKSESPNTRAPDTRPALVVAAALERADYVKALLDAGAWPNLEARHGETALTEAAKTGRVDVVRVLLEGGADINKPGTEGETALIKAVRAGHLGVVRVLLESGARADDTDLTGYSAREIADRNGFRAISDVLRQAEEGPQGPEEPA